MKKFKIVLLALLGFISMDSFAQTGHQVRTHTYHGTPVFASYSDYGHHSRIGFLADELYLSRRQANRMDDILRYYDREIDRVLNERWTNRRLKRAKINNLVTDKDRDIRSILSRRQYSKYRVIKSWNTDRRNNFSCNAHGGSCRSNACYNGFYNNRWNDGWSRYWNNGRRGSWERDNRGRGNNRDDRWDNRRNDDRRNGNRNDRRDNDDRWNDRDDRWDDRRGSNHPNRPKVSDPNNSKPSVKEREDVKYTENTPSNDEPSNDELATTEPERELSEEEEMDEYFADEFDYGDEDLDDYFKDENQ